MTKFLKKGYLKIKCKECHKQHSFESRDLIFDKKGTKHICEGDFFCDCDTKIKYEIVINETETGELGNVTYECKNGDIYDVFKISTL